MEIKGLSEEHIREISKIKEEDPWVLDFRLKILDAPIYIETRNFNDYSCWKEAFEAAGFAAIVVS